MDTNTGLLETKTHRPKILLGDDHRVVAEGIARILQAEYELLPFASDGEALVEIAVKDEPDIAIVDITMPRLSGIDAARRLRMLKPMIPIIFLTMHAEPAMVKNALNAGVKGYVLKSSAGEELLHAIQEVLQGRIYISPSLLPGIVGKSQVPEITARQRMVLNLIASGLRSREIAEQLDLSVRTIEAHRQALIQSFDVRNSIELIREATRLGVVTDK